MAEASAKQQQPFNDDFGKADNEEGDRFISGFQASPRKGGHVVVAIDIGTTFSGYAMSFSSGKFSIYAMRATDPYRPESGAATTKVPTTLLLRPDRTFHSFGHEAMNYYHRELDEDEQKRWHYFERFKMKLHAEPNLSRLTCVKAANGLEMPIRSVFAFALRHFKEAAIRECGFHSGTDVPPSEFEWVVTVPAIWKGGAKQTMREAAYEAGLASEGSPDKLTIALEPESASMYCKSMKRIGHSCNDEGLVTQAFTSGTTYVLADLGGGTADVTVHQVTDDGGVKELHHATGGAWGGTYVDKNFIELLEKIFGKETIEAYKTEYPGDWVELVSIKFETNKRMSAPGSTTYVEFPYSFHSFVGGSTVKDKIAAMGNANLKFTRGAVAIKYPEVRKMFEPVFQNIAEHLETIIRTVGQVQYMILVGGFATCSLLRAYLRDRFEKPFNLRIIVPFESSLAVVMGAVLFGHDPTEIRSRRLRYSYGIECLGRPELPDSSDFPDLSSGRFVSSMKSFKHVKLPNMFKTFVRKNQEVAIDEEVTHSFYPSHASLTAVPIRVYESDKETTIRVDEDGVRRVATFSLPMPDTRLGRNRQILVSMKFGQTEFKVHSLDTSSGQEVKGRVKLDFLSVAYGPDY
ncbi:heat shock 70 kDa protein 12A-like isoform X2 [Oscarella lobularis]|uniref:heat shock 70 kDa protein 12A-like isoform X2 n=1 Tax=Oscarella lobularis TaxID=121494 RepID=UPI0033131186